MEMVQTMSEKTKKIKLIYGNPPPPVHGVWKFSDPPVGPMEKAKIKNLNSFLTMVKMYSNKPRINHFGI